MILTIAVPTLKERASQSIKLFELLENQIISNKLIDEVQILSYIDNRERSVGYKRQWLYENAKGKYCVQIDDDDWVSEDYIITVVNMLKENPYCTHIGYKERCKMVYKDHTDEFIAIHSSRFPDWSPTNFPCFRTPYFKDPIRTDICRSVGVKDMGHGEDHDFSKRLMASGLLTKEVFIDKEMYFYTFTDGLKSYEPDSLKIEGGSGLTSCLNVRLHQFIKWCNEHKGELPKSIDSSGQFGFYKESNEDISNLIVNYNREGIEKISKIDYDHAFQYGWYDKIGIEKLFNINRICNFPSQEVRNTSNEILNLIGTRTCVLYRGNDKALEIPRIPYSMMIEMAKDTGDTSFFVQTDEKEFYDYFKSQFPDTIKWEIPMISKNDFGHVIPDNRIKFISQFNAVLLSISKSGKVILTTGNTGEFVCLYRGHTNNVWQVHGFEQKWRRLTSSFS